MRSQNATQSSPAAPSLVADARAVAACVAIQHDGGASTPQVAHALGWPADRLTASIAWLVSEGLLNASPAGDDEWPFAYLRQNARTDAFLTG